MRFSRRRFRVSRRGSAGRRGRSRMRVGRRRSNRGVRIGYRM